MLLLFMVKSTILRPRVQQGQYCTLLDQSDCRYFVNVLIANKQNICNLIGREEYSIFRIVLLVSILYSLTKVQQHSISVTQKNRTLLIKIKIMINYSLKIIPYRINLFVPNAPFLYPLKASENRKVF